MLTFASSKWRPLFLPEFERVGLTIELAARE